MRLIIDADACPKLHQVISIGREHNLEIHLFHDTCHEFHIEDVTIHLVDKGSDSADFSIVNFCKKGDIVITRDGGLAAMILAKLAFAVNTSGLEYNDNNILGVLTNRHLGKKERMRQKHSALKCTRMPREQHTSLRETLVRIITKNKRDS